MAVINKSFCYTVKIKILTAASNPPGAITRFSKTELIFVTRLSTEACSWGVGVKSCALFSNACDQIES